MRKFLDKLYLISGYLAGAFLSLMALLILAQIVARWFGVIIPSTEDFSGFLLAATSFMALAYTLRSGDLIRVNLFIGHIKGPARNLIEGSVLVIALVLMGYAAWYMILLAIESYQFEELSQGYIPVPLWIPQIPMALGMLIFCIALLDELVSLIRGETPHYLKHDDSATLPELGGE